MLAAKLPNTDAKNARHADCNWHSEVLVRTFQTSIRAAELN